MNTTLTALAAAAAIAIATTAAPTDAFAQRRGAVAAGIIGGLAAGAIIGGALSGPGYYGYGPGPVYYGPPPRYYGPACRLERHRYWDGYAWRWQRVEVCY